MYPVQTFDTRHSPSTTSSDSQEDQSNLPMLRLTMKSLNLATAPAPPLPTRTSSVALDGSAESTSESPTSSTEDIHSSSNEHCSGQAHDSPVPLPQQLSKSCSSLALTTSFIIPSVNTLRKQKMDRLRRKLGADVPFELVFPNDGDSDDRDSVLEQADVSPLTTPEELPAAASLTSPEGPPALASQIQEPVILKEEEPLSLAPSLSRKRLPRSTSSHDLTPTQPAQNQVPPMPQNPPRYRRPRTAPAAPNAHALGFKRVKEKLSLILETPDEYGNSQQQGAPLSRVSSTDSSDFQSEWYRSAAGSQSSFWDSQSTTSTNITTPASSSPAVSIKRPSSYRKPPPPIPDDLSLLLTMRKF